MDGFRELLACPACAGALSGEWSCGACGARFDAPDGIPNLRLAGDPRTEAVRRFYIEHFIGHQAGDMRLDLTSRTATAERVVDEMTISFTHDVEIPWMLPGVPPTGRFVTVPIVAVIAFADGLVDSEHIYWDQATVLAQIGLLDPTGLPVTGAEQAALVAAEADPDAFRVMGPGTGRSGPAAD